MDRRLASILCAAFDDCSCVEQMFKLITIAGTLIERPVIKDPVKIRKKVWKNLWYFKFGCISIL